MIIPLHSMARIIRANLATLLAAEITDFHMFSAGKVAQVVGDRIQLRWEDGVEMWFDSEAVQVLG